MLQYKLYMYICIRNKQIKYISLMTKEDLNQMCREYQQVLSMNESEVQAMYEESKAECIASFEAEIDYWENYFGYKY